jgi:chromosome segregation ATPase
MQTNDPPNPLMASIARPDQNKESTPLKLSHSSSQQMLQTPMQQATPMMHQANPNTTVTTSSRVVRTISRTELPRIVSTTTTIRPTSVHHEPLVARPFFRPEDGQEGPQRIDLNSGRRYKPSPSLRGSLSVETQGERNNCYDSAGGATAATRAYAAPDIQRVQLNEFNAQLDVGQISLGPSNSQRFERVGGYIPTSSSSLYPPQQQQGVLIVGRSGSSTEGQTAYNAAVEKVDALALLEQSHRRQLALVEERYRKLQRESEDRFEITVKNKDKELSGLKEHIEKVHGDYERRVQELESSNRTKEKDISEGLGIIKNLQEENQKFQELIAQGLRQIQDTKTENETLLQSNEELDANIQELKEEIQSWVQKCHQSEQEKGQEKESLKQARAEIDKMRLECGKALEALKISRELEDKLQTELETVRNENARHMSDMELTERKRNEELCDRIDTMGQKIGQLTRANEDLQRDLVSAQSEIERQRGRLESQSHLVQNLQDSLAEKTGDLENARRSREDTLNTIDSLEQKLEQLTEDIQSLSSANTLLEGRLAQASSELHSLTTSTLPTLTSTLSQQRTELALKTQEVADLNAFIYKLESELRDTAVVLRTLEGELKQKKEEDEEERDRLLGALREERDRREQVEGLLQDIARERDRLDSRGRELEDRLRTAEDKERTAAKEREASESREKELVNEIEGKEGELVELATFCKSLQGEVLTLRPLSRTLKTLSTENENLVSTLNSIEADYEEFKKEMMWKENDNNQRTEELQHENNRLIGELARVNERTTTVMAKLATAYAEIERLGGDSSCTDRIPMNSAKDYSSRHHTTCKK